MRHGGEETWGTCRGKERGEGSLWRRKVIVGRVNFAGIWDNFRKMVIKGKRRKKKNSKKKIEKKKESSLSRGGSPLSTFG